jgi:hypothetical protein
MSMNINIARKRNMGFTLEEIVLDALKAEAKARGVTASSLVNRWLLLHLEESEDSYVKTCMAARRHFFEKEKKASEQSMLKRQQEINAAFSQIQHAQVDTTEEFVEFDPFEGLK